MSRPDEDEVGAFLARWSRRKAAARRGTPEAEPASAEPGAGDAPTTAEPRVGTAAGAPAPPPATAADPGPTPEPPALPDPDTLDAASDFSPFMRPGVPAELRRRALRRLWKVNPIIGTPDGLDDYYVVNDFTDASTVVADLKTLYRVGRGMVAALEETVAEAEGGPAGGPGEPLAASPETAQAVPDGRAPAAPAAVAEGGIPADPQAPPAPEPLPLRPLTTGSRV